MISIYSLYYCIEEDEKDSDKESIDKPIKNDVKVSFNYPKAKYIFDYLNTFDNKSAINRFSSNIIQMFYLNNFFSLI